MFNQAGHKDTSRPVHACVRASRGRDGRFMLERTDLFQAQKATKSDIFGTRSIRVVPFQSQTSIISLQSHTSSIRLFPQPITHMKHSRFSLPTCQPHNTDTHAGQKEECVSLLLLLLLLLKPARLLSRSTLPWQDMQQQFGTPQSPQSWLTRHQKTGGGHTSGQHRLKQKGKVIESQRN